MCLLTLHSSPLMIFAFTTKSTWLSCLLVILSIPVRCLPLVRVERWRSVLSGFKRWQPHNLLLPHRWYGGTIVVGRWNPCLYSLLVLGHWRRPELLRPRRDQPYSSQERRGRVGRLCRPLRVASHFVAISGAQITGPLVFHWRPCSVLISDIQPVLFSEVND